MEGFGALAKNEGIIPALESSHAVYAAMQIAKTLRPDQDVLVGLSGRGDKGIYSIPLSVSTYVVVLFSILFSFPSLFFFGIQLDTI